MSELEREDENRYQGVGLANSDMGHKASYGEITWLASRKLFLQFVLKLFDDVLHLFVR